MVKGHSNSEFAGGGLTSQRLFGPAEALQVKAVPVIELDAFLFQQALLADVTAVAGGGVGHLTPRIDDAVPRNVALRVKVLEYAADKTSAPW